MFLRFLCCAGSSCRIAAFAAVAILMSPSQARSQAGMTIQPTCSEAAGLVAAADPNAVGAGIRMLARGGSAFDAAGATKAALTFVEAPETGIGGGGFLLHWRAADGALTFYDGREVAPQGATPRRFLLPGGRPIPFPTAVISGRAIGVPGMVAMLHMAHGKHGKLPWRDLFQPAVDMARTGVPMPERLRRQLSGDPSLLLFRGARRNLRGQRGDDRLQNAELADTLERVAQEGPSAFYQGEIAQGIIEAATGRRLWPSDMTLDDLTDYRALEREPVCGTYRQWRICGAPPPSSGGIAVLQILKMLERFDLRSHGPGSLQAVHLVAEASRLAFADRDRYVGDPAFVDVPVEDLLSPVYLSARSALISPDRAMDQAPAGDPLGVQPATGGGFPPSDIDEEGKEADDNGTSHLVTMDREGNVVSLTGSIESPFGSRLMVRGFLLNNQLTDFSFRPTSDGTMRANAVAPGKRPRSSMAPTIVFGPDGSVRLAIGSRGGSRIIGYVIKSLVGVLDWNLGIQEAVALPNFLHRGQTLELERGTSLEDLAPGLTELGHRVEVRSLTSGLHGLERAADTVRGGADPRLGGTSCGAGPR